MERSHRCTGASSIAFRPGPNRLAQSGIKRSNRRAGASKAFVRNGRNGRRGCGAAFRCADAGAWDRSGRTPHHDIGSDDLPLQGRRNAYPRVRTGRGYQGVGSCRRLQCRSTLGCGRIRNGIHIHGRGTRKQRNARHRGAQPQAPWRDGTKPSMHRCKQHCVQARPEPPGAIRDKTQQPARRRKQGVRSQWSQWSPWLRRRLPLRGRWGLGPGQLEKIRYGLRPRVHAQLQSLANGLVERIRQRKREVYGLRRVLETVDGGRRRLAGQGMVKGGSQTEDVRVGSKTRLRTVLFGRRVLRRQDARVLLGAVALERTRGSEIDKDGSPFRSQHDVVGLDVAMQQVAVMDLRQGRAQRTRHPPDLVQGQATVPFQPRAQRLPVQIFHHDIGRIVLEERIVDSHDARRVQAKSVPRLLQNALALVLESSPLLRGNGNGRVPPHRSRREEFLDGHRLPERSVGSSVGDAEAPFAQDPAYGVLALMQSSAGSQAVKRRYRARRANCSAGRTGNAGSRQRSIARRAGVDSHEKGGALLGSEGFRMRKRFMLRQRQGSRERGVEEQEILSLTRSCRSDLIAVKQSVSPGNPGREGLTSG